MLVGVFSAKPSVVNSLKSFKWCRKVEKCNEF